MTVLLCTCHVGGMQGQRPCKRFMIRSRYNKLVVVMSAELKCSEDE